MNQRNVWIRAVTAGLAVAVPIVVGISRMYQGVHYLSHVVVGVVLGAASVIAVYIVVQHSFVRGGRECGPSAGIRRARTDAR